MTLFFIGLATFVSTFLGGLFALRFKDKLHLITGFSAGTVMGVALFDLLPETFNLVPYTASLFIGLGFVIYLILDRTIALHSAHDECENTHHQGTLGAMSLIFHSFLDGVIIGASFQVSTIVGTLVTTAVLAHDFSDGINTITLIKRGNMERKATYWLIADALAPFLGILLVSLFTIPENALGPIIGIFCGFFLYLGASNLIPESHHAHKKILTTLLTLLGIGTMYLIIQVV